MRAVTVVLLGCAVTSIAISGAGAQRISRAGIDGFGPARVDVQNGLGVGGTRLFASVGGLALGMVAGGVIGYRILPHCGGCEDPGLEQLVYGALAGGAIGAAFGASLPDLDSVCTFQQRVTRSLIGAGGAAAGAVILSGGLNEIHLLAVPAVSVAGALGALGRCWKSRLS